MSAYCLYIGNKRSGIMVRPDEKYPDMWRVHHKDEVSDMVNLSRAKDAAITWARAAGLTSGGTMTKGFHWKMTVHG